MKPEINADAKTSTEAIAYRAQRIFSGSGATDQAAAHALPDSFSRRPHTYAKKGQGLY